MSLGLSHSRGTQVHSLLAVAFHREGRTVFPTLLQHPFIHLHEMKAGLILLPKYIISVFLKERRGQISVLAHHTQYQLRR